MTSTWREARLKEFCTTGSGGTPSRSQGARYYDGGTVPWVKSGELRESVILDSEEHVTHLAIKESSAKVVPAGALLIAIYGATVGRMGILGIAAATNQAICHIIPDPRIADSRFIYHALRSKVPNLVARGVGGAQPNISQGTVRDTILAIPPLIEQRRIADLLDRAEALRAKQRAAIAKLDEVEQATFLAFFGSPVSDEQWPRAMLQDLGRVSTGRTPATNKEGMFGGDIPFITPGDLESCNPVRRWVTEAGSIEAGTVGPGAALVCCIGATIGKVGRTTVRSAFNQQINAVDWGCRIDNAYGYAALCFLKPTIIARGSSTTLPILKKSSFEKLEIPVPPLERQADFGKAVAAVNRIRIKQKASAEHFRELAVSLQSRAFRGDL